MPPPEQIEALLKFHQEKDIDNAVTFVHLKICGFSQTASVLSAFEVGIPRRSIGLKGATAHRWYVPFSCLTLYFFPICRTACDLPTPGAPHNITDGNFLIGTFALIILQYAVVSSSTSLLIFICGIFAFLFVLFRSLFIYPQFIIYFCKLFF